MATLWDIDYRLKMLEELNVDVESGEIIDDTEFDKLFNEIQMDLHTKIEQTMCFYKSLISDAEAIENESKNLKKRADSKRKLAERLKARIDHYIESQYSDENGMVNMEEMNKFKFDTPKVYLSYRKSEKAIVDDITKLPKEFITTKVEEKPNLTEIKKAIKGGNAIEGAHIEATLNMQIK